MATSERVTKVTYKVDIPLVLLMILSLGYFVYPQWQGVFGIFIFTAVVALSALISAVPLVGIFLQQFALSTWIVPKVFELTGLWHTWLTGIIWIMALILGFIIYVLSTLWILVELTDS